MKTIEQYNELVRSKLAASMPHGFNPLPFKAPLFDWQKQIVAWALKRGSAALFEDCGLGKTIQQLEWSRQIAEITKRPVLILCPLAVAKQTVSEGVAFRIEVTHVHQPSEVAGGSRIFITNYDRMERFVSIIPRLSGICLDESSILKSMTGKTRIMLTEAFSQTPFRLCCSATPAPNDFTELGQHAEFLGICKSSEMLAEWFINDTFDTGTWRLKKHAEEPFWRWVASWAACVGKPSDIGFPDDGYILPEVASKIVTVAVDHRPEPGSDELFVMTTPSATTIHKLNRRTAEARCQAAADIVNNSEGPFVVWCESNDESELLSDLIHGAVEVRGSMSADKKEENLVAFTTGQARVIVTKPSIAGFGLNWQHCHQEIYVGMSYSFEKFYQASKRIHRFGQKKQVKRFIVQTDADIGVIRAINRKSDQHEQMRELMRFTREQLQSKPSIITLNTLIKSESSREFTIHHGDCVRVAQTIESDSIGFSIFSPPFADLFTYSSDIQDMGNCRNLDDFMVQFSFLIEQLNRITMPGRHVAVHCCDLLSAKWKDGNIELKDFSGSIVQAFRSQGFLFHARITIWKDPVTEMQRTKAHGLLYKTLKKDSADSRTGVPEYLLVFRKPGKNPKPIEHSEIDMPLSLWQEVASPVWMTVNQMRVLNGSFAREAADEKHICPLQLDVIERALHLWSAKGDTVFSPFTGIGSEAYCAIKMGRKFVGAELKESYWKTAVDYAKQAEQTSESLFDFANKTAS